jgi:hypothetical protein
MSKRIVSLALAALMIACSPAVYAQTAAQSEGAAAKVKAEIEKTGEGERVELRLRDGAKLKGRVSAIEDDRFTVVDRAGGETPVRYAEIKSVKRPFNPRRLKNTAWIVAGVLTPLVVAAAAVAVTGGQ